jgi:16S rRNA C967 or C1407 C5-methylase (RsmB/RsmF family)
MTQLLSRLSANHALKGKKTQFSPVGITFLNRPSINLSELDEFKKGLFEVQDEASQLVSMQVDCLVVVFDSKRLLITSLAN